MEDKPFPAAEDGNANDDAIAALFDGIPPPTLLLKITGSDVDGDKLQALVRDGVAPSYSGDACASRPSHRDDTEEIKLKHSPLGEHIKGRKRRVSAGEATAVPHV